jgi:pimeloyl-ACP methyl ester carboxylesterase
MYALVKDIRLAYGDRGRGRGTTLLLVHGFPLDRRLWAAQAGALQPWRGLYRRTCGGTASPKSFPVRSQWSSTPTIWPRSSII